MNLLELELQILRLINQPFFPLLNLIFAGIIFSIYAYLAFLIFFLYRKGEKRKILHLVFSLIVGMAFVLFLKYSIRRERPYAAHEDIKHIFTKADPSFPSSHTFVSILCLFFLPKQFPKSIKILITFYLLVLIPIGSLYTGVHYPSDVIVSGLLGFIFPKVFNENLSVKIFKKIFRIDEEI